MFEIFNSDFTTLAVNIIVSLGFLLFIFFMIKKLLSTFVVDNLKTKIQTSTTSQNIFTFVSVVIASTFLDLFADKNFDMLWTVLVISILTIIFNFIYDKVRNKNDAIDNKQAYLQGLSLVEEVINLKGFSLIKSENNLAKIENDSIEIYIFTENLITDIPKEELEDINTFDHDNIGLFAQTVAKNIPTTKYIYFLKNTEDNKKYKDKYDDHHFRGKNAKFKSNVSFYFINEEDFCFYSELYLYKFKNEHNDINKLTKDKAFEWIPSIGKDNDGENKQFYLELSSMQTQSINEIICELIISIDTYNIQGIEDEF